MVKIVNSLTTVRPKYDTNLLSQIYKRKNHLATIILGMSTEFRSIYFESTDAKTETNFRAIRWCRKRYLEVIGVNYFHQLRLRVWSSILRKEIYMTGVPAYVSYLNVDIMAIPFVFFFYQRCCDMGQNDTVGKIELNPLSSCQVIILIARMTFNCSTSCLMS